VPSLLNKDIQIDRRSRTPESTPAVSGAAVPSFAELERAPIAAPPGMTPARQAPQAAAVPPAMRPAQRLPTPAPMPAVQVASTPPSMPPRGPTGVAVPSSSAQALQGDPDQTLPDTFPGTPVPKMAPAPAPVAADVSAPAVSARAPVDDPDATAPGNPPFPAAPSSAAPVTGSIPIPRPVTAPAEVVTFAAPSRLPVPPAAQRPPEPSAAPAPAQARPRKGGAANTDELQEIHARPASLWRRLLSFTIDTTALVGVATLYILLASSIAGVKPPSSQGLTPLDSIAAWMHAAKSVLLPGIILLLVLATVYCAVAAFLWNGRTLGRLLLGLRLVDTHGLAPAPSRAIVRALLSVVSFGLFLGGFWMALFDRRGQTLHDKLTSTFVVQPS
jgi:uncharacterized RDD family membrane protein YckC